MSSAHQSIPGAVSWQAASACIALLMSVRSSGQRLQDAVVEGASTAYVLEEWLPTGPGPASAVTVWCSAEGGVKAHLEDVAEAPFPQGNGAFQVEIAKGPGARATDAQLSFTTRQHLARGGRYSATFWVRSSRRVAFAAAVRRYEAPWTLLSEESETTIDAGPAWKEVVIPFAPGQDVSAKTEIRSPGFFLGELPTDTTLWIAGVTLWDLQAPEPLPTARSPELLRNPGFADGMAGWDPQAAEVTTATGVGVNGSAACLVRNRAARWGSPVQDIREALIANGWTVYDFGAAIRRTEGRGEGFVVIHIRDGNGDRWIASGKRHIGDRGFCRLRAQRFIHWEGVLQAANISVQTTGDDTGGLIVDDVSLCAVVDLARGRTFQASSATPGHEADLAFDGKPATSWQSTAAGVGWLEVDFGESLAFDGCVVGVGSRHTGDYQIQYWDGAWHTAFGGNDIRAPLDELRFPTVSGRRGRLLFDGGQEPPVVSEFRLYAYGGAPAEASGRTRIQPPPADPSQRGRKTLVGTIRWDGWCGDRHPVGLELERAMGPAKYHFRLPFYATVRGKEQVETRCVTQEIMDREIAFAEEAGIDYWAFDWYPPGTGLALARELYLTSECRDAVRWCVILATNPFSDADRAWLIEQFKTPNYQCVLGDRPLVYVFDAKQTYSALVRALRENAARAGVPTPFVVFMGWSAAIAKAADACGADAIGAYVNPVGNGSAFAANMAHESNQWQALRSTGLQVVPTVTTGWDPRPFLDNPAPWYHGATETNWVERATPHEVATQLREALAFVDAYPDASLANSVLIYAWNENAEGGWVIPTLDELRNARCPLRLDAIRGVLKPHVPRRSAWDALPSPLGGRASEP